MKKTDYLVELRELSEADLKARIKEISEELMKLRFRKASNQLEQGHVYSEARVKLAQAKTVLNEKQAAA